MTGTEAAGGGKAVTDGAEKSAASNPKSETPNPNSETPNSEEVTKLRAEVLDLDKKRTEMEAKATKLRDYLCGPGMPGLKGGLDDAEGYPRADLDIYGICQARNELACLNTDYDSLMKDLHEKLLKIHALSPKPQ